MTVILMASRLSSLGVALPCVLRRYGLMEQNGCNSSLHSGLWRFVFMWFIHSGVSSVLSLWPVQY